MTATKIIQNRSIPVGSAVCDDPLLDRIYRSRGIQNLSELDQSLNKLLPPNLLAGMEEAVNLLIEALQTQQKIIVVGDFDVDGATSTTLIITALRQLGFSQVSYLIPNRFEQGYGLSVAVAEIAVSQRAELVITVDNGVSSLEGVAYLRKQGVKVLITDHHLPSEELPNANAIVNPNLPSCNFPSKFLAGVGVAFYLMLALRARLRDMGTFSSQNQPNFLQLLDLVALGTIADLVPLDHNNRILAFNGLELIRQGRCRAGILALIEVANRKPHNLTSQDLSFAIAPRINSAGRLDSMNFGVDLLLCEDLNLARQKALKLDDLNQTRREIEAGMQAEALAICQNLHNLNSQYKNGIVLYHHEWHQGVIGLLASRVKDQYHRPVIVFTEDSENDPSLLKGSARSVEGVHIRDVLERMHSQNRNLLVRFGGHAMAAGLTIPKARWQEFAEIFNHTVTQWLADKPLENIILTDGELDPSELNLANAEKLQQLGVWGQQFPTPLFHGEFQVLQQQLLKNKHLKLLVSPINSNPALNLASGGLLDAIAFNIDTSLYPDLSIKKLNLVYQLAVNEFREQRKVQLIVEYLEPLN